jgi:hypothetical protein
MIAQDYNKTLRNASEFKNNPLSGAIPLSYSQINNNKDVAYSRIESLKPTAMRLLALMHIAQLYSGNRFLADQTELGRRSGIKRNRALRIIKDQLEYSGLVSQVHKYQPDDRGLNVMRRSRYELAADVISYFEGLGLTHSNLDFFYPMKTKKAYTYKKPDFVRFLKKEIIPSFSVDKNDTANYLYKEKEYERKKLTKERMTSVDGKALDFWGMTAEEDAELASQVLAIDRHEAISAEMAAAWDRCFAKEPRNARPNGHEESCGLGLAKSEETHQREQLQRHSRCAMTPQGFTSEQAELVEAVFARNPSRVAALMELKAISWCLQAGPKDCALC